VSVRPPIHGFQRAPSTLRLRLRLLRLTYPNQYLLYLLVQSRQHIHAHGDTGEMTRSEVCLVHLVCLVSEQIDRIDPTDKMTTQ